MLQNIGAISTAISGISNIAQRFFGGPPAVEAPQIPNIQTVGETQESGTEEPLRYTQANPIATFGPEIARGIHRN